MRARSAKRSQRSQVRKPSVTDSPICVVSSTWLSLGFLGKWIGSFRSYGLFFVLVNLARFAN